MAYDESKVCISLEAGQDLSAAQYHFVSVASDGQVDATGAGLAAIGVLQNDPSAAGRAAEVCVGGLTKVAAGGTVAAGAVVAANAAGKAVAATTGDIVLGTAVTGGADGSIISMVFNPSNISA